MKFKLRAECHSDLVNLSEALRCAGIEFTIHTHQELGYPDCEAEIDADTLLDNMRSIISTLPDSHVMLETVLLAEQYDGIRRKV